MILEEPLKLKSEKPYIPGPLLKSVLEIVSLPVISLPLSIISEAPSSISVLFILAIKLVGFWFNNPIGFNQESGYVCLTKSGRLLSFFAESQHSSDPLWPGTQDVRGEETLKMLRETGGCPKTRA